MLSKTVSKHINRDLIKELPEWFQTDTCIEHRTYVINWLTRALIFKQCKDLSSQIKLSTSSTKPPEKLQILQIK